MSTEYDKKIGITDVETLNSMVSSIYLDGLNETTDFSVKKSIVEDIFGAAFVDPTDYNMEKILSKDYLIENTEGHPLATVINETKTLFAFNIQEELSEGTLTETTQEDLEQIVNYLFDTVFGEDVEDVDYNEFDTEDFDFGVDLEEIFGKQSKQITDDDIEKLKGMVSDLVSGFGGFFEESKQKVSEKQKEYKEKRQEKRETPAEEPTETPFGAFKKSFKRPDSPAETKVKNFFKELKEKSLDISDQVRPFVDSTIEQSKPLIDKASQTVKDGFEKTKEVSKDISKDISEYVKSDLKEDVADLGNKAEDFVSGLSKQEEDVPSLEDIFKALGKDPKDVSFEDVDAEYQRQLAEKRKARKSRKGDSEKKLSKGMSIEDYLNSLNKEQPETSVQEEPKGFESARFVTLDELLKEFTKAESPTPKSEKVKKSKPKQELTPDKEIETDLEQDLLKLGKVVNSFLNSVSEKIISTLDGQPEPTKTQEEVDFILSNVVALIQAQQVEQAVSVLYDLYEDNLFVETPRYFYVGTERTHFKQLVSDNFIVEFLDTSKLIPEELFEAISIKEIFPENTVIFSLKISNGVLISIKENR